MIETSSPPSEEIEPYTIKAALVGWGLTLDLDGEDFDWAARASSVAAVCASSSSACSHAPYSTFEKFLELDMAELERCTLIYENTGGDLASLWYLAAIFFQTRLDANSKSDDFNFVANYRVENRDLPPLPALNGYKDFESFITEKIFEHFNKFPEKFKEILLDSISQKKHKGHEWEIPERAVESEPLSYVFSGSGDVYEGEDMLEYYARTLEYFYTKVAPGLYIVPTRFLRLRLSAGPSFPGSWIRGFLDQRPELETFFSLCGVPILDPCPVLDSDDVNVLEALKVFYKEMPFKDALSAARVI